MYEKHFNFENNNLSGIYKIYIFIAKRMLL